MASFYGGKQGMTYHIVERYDNVEQMVAAFKQGGAYTDVNYGQYVIIDTILNLHEYNNTENGLLYRRGFQYNQVIEEPTNQHPGGGAIYVGQIVGPQGDNSEIRITDWGTEPSEGAPTTVSTGLAGLVPGIIINGTNSTFNNNITSKVINIADEYGHIQQAQLQFQIPYPVIRISATQVGNNTGEITHTWYSSAGSTTSASWLPEPNNNVLIDEYHNEDTPFYYDYQIAIPKGEPGVKQITSVGDNLYVQYSDDVTPSTGTTATIEGKEGVWYLFATSQGAYHSLGKIEDPNTLTTDDYKNGFKGAQAGWVVQIGDDLYAYDYIAAGIAPGGTPATPSSGEDYVGTTYWKKVYNYGEGFQPTKLLTTTTSTATMTTVTAFQNLNPGGIIFRVTTDHSHK